MRSHSNKLSKWHAAALAGALSAALTAAAPLPARAGFLDFLFGGLQGRPTPPADVNSYAEPSAPAGPVTPMPTGQESVRSRGSTGHTVVFCVRLCDGLHFPLEHMSNSTPIETCRAMCPASRTKVFFGSEIDHAVAADGARYADLDNAFVYRKHLVANCTCNGKDAFGLAPFDLSSDPTLRPGDIVSTGTGFKAYTGKRGQADSFAPVDPAAVGAEPYSGSAPVHLTRGGQEPAFAAEEPGTAPPQSDIQAAR